MFVDKEILGICPLTLFELMDYFRAAEFFNIATTLTSFEQEAKDKGSNLISEVERSRLIQFGQELHAYCANTHLETAVMAVANFLQTLGWPSDPNLQALGSTLLREIHANFPISHAGVRELLADVHRSIERELRIPTFFRVDRSDFDFIKTTAFGKDVKIKFSSADFDIKAAAQCLMFGQSTACVFHLMRVVEIGLKAIGKTLNADIAMSSWEKLLFNIRDALKQRDFSSNPEPPKAFFDGLISYLYAIKDAWRNPMMHVEETYSQQEAKVIYSTVCAFMQRLITKLSDGRTG